MALQWVWGPPTLLDIFRIVCCNSMDELWMKNSATEVLLSVGKFIKKIYLPFIFSPMRCSPLSLREIKKLYTNIFNWWIEKTPKPTEDTTLSLLSFLKSYLQGWEFAHLLIAHFAHQK